MTDFVFADRYAAEGISPPGEIIAARTPPAERILEEITEGQVLDLVRLYYGSRDVDLNWFRDEFVQEDASFSLVNNERETRVLAAAILEALVTNEDCLAILALASGYINGHRVPAQSKPLVSFALECIGKQAVEDRKPRRVEKEVVPVFNAKLGEEIAALGANNWPLLIELLAKINNEIKAAVRNTASKTNAAVSTLQRQIGLHREETQMLWWLIGGYSKTLERSFSAFAPAQAAIVGAVDLGDLTSVTRLGPVAAPEMLNRIISLAKRPKGTIPKDLASSVDSIDGDDLKRLRIFPDLPPRIAPVTSAIDLARTIGPGAWRARFEDLTGLSATIEFEPIDLAVQLYREHLLGQLV